MDHKKLTLDELAKKASQITSKYALVGFDGSIDRIISLVDKRFGPGDNFQAINTIEEFGKRVTAASGKSTNIEMFVKMEKLGGNGPIMANALAEGGANLRYIGALGTPGNIHPVFADFAQKTDALSIVAPCVTSALEFTDGKILMGETTSLDQITYQYIVDTVGEGMWFDILSRQDLLAMVNWTMTPNMTSLLVAILEKVLPNLPPRDTRNYFFDLSDPEKRPHEETRAVLQVISRFQNFGAVTLGLNLKEAQQVFALLGYTEVEADEEGLKTMASRIRQKLEISCVVIHPKESAACSTKNETVWIAGPYEEYPKITTGAGDHFNAGFATALLLRLPPLACLTVGVSFSSYYVRTAQSPSLSDIQTFIRDWED